MAKQAPTRSENNQYPISGKVVLRGSTPGVYHVLSAKSGGEYTSKAEFSIVRACGHFLIWRDLRDIDKAQKITQGIFLGLEHSVGEADHISYSMALHFADEIATIQGYILSDETERAKISNLEQHAQTSPSCADFRDIPKFAKGEQGRVFRVIVERDYGGDLPF